jgi:hypothetical protein
MNDRAPFGRSFGIRSLWVRRAASAAGLPAAGRGCGGFADLVVGFMASG